MRPVALESDGKPALQAGGLEVAPAEGTLGRSIAPAHVQELVFAEQLEAIGQVPAQARAHVDALRERIRLRIGAARPVTSSAGARVRGLSDA